MLGLCRRHQSRAGFALKPLRKAKQPQGLATHSRLSLLQAKVSLADSKISLTVAVPLKDAAALVACVEQWAGSSGINVNTTLSR